MTRLAALFRRCSCNLCALRFKMMLTVVQKRSRKQCFRGITCHPTLRTCRCFLATLFIFKLLTIKRKIFLAYALSSVHTTVLCRLFVSHLRLLLTSVCFFSILCDVFYCLPSWLARQTNCPSYCNYARLCLITVWTNLVSVMKQRELKKNEISHQKDALNSLCLSRRRTVIIACRYARKKFSPTVDFSLRRFRVIQIIKIVI